MYCYILQVYLQPDHIHLNYPLLFNDMIHSVMIYYEKVLDIFSHVLTPESDKELFIDGAWASDVLTREPE